MTALVDWARTHTSRLFPMSAEYTAAGGGAVVQVRWQAEPYGTAERPRHAAALEFEQSVIDAVYLASPPELARIGSRLTDLVSRWLACDDIACLGKDVLVIPVDAQVLEH